MSQAAYKDRYLKFLEEYFAQLPETMSEAERRQQALDALDQFFAQDLEAIGNQTEEELQSLFDQAALLGEDHVDADEQAKLAAVRQSL